jgi:Ca2+-binding RTX toxin-like protein
VHGAGTFNTVMELQRDVSLTLGSPQLGSNVQEVVLAGGNNTVDFSSATTAVYLYGGSGNDTLEGGAGHDFLFGGAGDDTFVFKQGLANGDTIGDFDGHAPGDHDMLEFLGFGTAAQGATFTQVGTTDQWQIHSGLDGHNETITFANHAHPQQGDYVFV